MTLEEFCSWFVWDGNGKSIACMDRLDVVRVLGWLERIGYAVASPSKEYVMSDNFSRGTDIENTWDEFLFISLSVRSDHCVRLGTRLMGDLVYSSDLPVGETWDDREDFVNEEDFEGAISSLFSR